MSGERSGCNRWSANGRNSLSEQVLRVAVGFAGGIAVGIAVGFAVGIAVGFAGGIAVGISFTVNHRVSDHTLIVLTQKRHGAILRAPQIQ